MCQWFASSTNLGLIQESILHPENLQVGKLVYQKYAAIIARTVQSQGLLGQDLEDIVHETLRRVVSGFCHFTRRRRGSFRAWLRRVTRSATVEFIRKNRQMDGPTARRVGQNVANSMVQEYDLEILEMAIRRVQLEVHPRHWAFFEKVHLQDCSPKEVAQGTGLTTDAIYKACQRVEKRLIQIARDLDSRGMGE